MFFLCIKLDKKIHTYLVESSTQSSLVIQNSCSVDYPVSYRIAFKYKMMAGNGISRAQ